MLHNRFIKYFLIIIVGFIIIHYILINSNPFKKILTKKDIINLIPQEHKPKTWMYESNITNFPVIFKPNNCPARGVGVHLINNSQEIENYISKYGKDNIIVQEFIPYENEVGVLYERNPFSRKGNIASIIKARNLGGTKLNQKFCKEEYKNKKKLITQKLTNKIDKISKNIPDFYVGRYDIRYRDDESFKKGENFYILEANGVMGYDGRCLEICSSWDVPRFIIYGTRWSIIRILYGLFNILKGNVVPSPNIIKYYKNGIKCKRIGKSIEIM